MKKVVFNLLVIMVMLAMVITPASARSVANDGGPVQFTPVAAEDVVPMVKYPDGVDKAIKGATGQTRFIFILEDAPVVTYDGSVTGYEATTPEETGKNKLDMLAPAVIDYVNYLGEKQEQTLQSMEKVVGYDLEPAFRYKTALNGFALDLDPEEVLKIVEKVPGILRVEREVTQYVDTDAGPAFIGADGVWDTETYDTMGEGVVVGILDTGINFDHVSFADPGPKDGYDYTNPMGQYFGVCDPTSPQYDDSYVCSAKLLGAYSFVSAYESLTPEDSEGHGSHTASTVAGNVIDSTMARPTFSDTQTISGVAPHASIISYDVCYLGGGCPGAAILAAIDQATADGVDVINFSISGGEDPYNDSAELAFLNATTAGVFVSTSAGNDGPSAETTAHRSPWLLTTAASTHNRTYDNAVTSMTGGDTTPPADIAGKGFTSGLASASIVYAGAYGNRLCLLDSEGGTWTAGTDFTGKIVVCDRGTSARVDKAVAVADKGAAGYVLANDVTNGDSLTGDAYVIPGVHISYTDGAALKAWLASGTGQMATIQGAVRNMDASNGNIMADFSSRGPNTTIDVLKPELTAPGVDIWAAVAGASDAFDFYSGTSMSSPHTAGAAALLTAVHPDWTPSEMKSAMMLTAYNASILKEDAATQATPMEYGSGLVQVDLAAGAGLIMDETKADYLAANPADGGNPQDLNLASGYNSMCLGECSWTREVTNALELETSWTTGVVEPTGVTITVTPANFTLAAGATQEITITANVEAAEIGEWYFGEALFTEDSGLAPDSHIPLAVMPSSGILPDKVSIDTRRNAGSKLVEDLLAMEITNLTVENYGLVKAEPLTVDLAQDPTNGTGQAFDDLSQVFVTWVDVPADAVRLVTEITESPSQDMDLYVGLDDGDGVVESAETVCSSATGAVFESCDMMMPDAGSYWILVQNWTSSAPDAIDTSVLSVGVVTGDEGNMVIDGPSAVAQSTLFDLGVYWDIPEMMAGERYYGAFSLGSDAANPGNIGTIPVDLIRYTDDVTKTADMDTALYGDVVTYTISIQPNITGKDMTYYLEDAIPAGMSLVPDSITGGAYQYGNKIIWSGVMPGKPFYNITTDATDPLCDTGFGGYVNLADFGIHPQSSVSGDSFAYTAFSTQDPFVFFGTTYNGLGFTDDGFILFDTATNYDGIPWVNQTLPDPNYPNNVAAMLWKDMYVTYDAATNKGVSLASAGKDVTIVEYDDIEDYDDETQTYDFEAVLYSGIDNAPGAYEMVFAYDNLNGGLNPVTIGVENAKGNEAFALVNNSDASSVISDGTMVCLDYVGPSEPYVITYQLQVTSHDLVQVTNTVKHTVMDDPGALEAYADFTLWLNRAGVYYLPIIFK